MIYKSNCKYSIDSYQRSVDAFYCLYELQANGCGVLQDSLLFLDCLESFFLYITDLFVSVVRGM